MDSKAQDDHPPYTDNATEWRRDKRADLHARLQASPYRPIFPSLFFANIRSLANKIDEIESLRIISCWRDSCVTVVTKMWLDNNILDAVVELTGHSLFQADRTAASDKSRGGGLVLYVHNAWCMPHTVSAHPALLIWNTWR